MGFHFFRCGILRQINDRDAENTVLAGNDRIFELLKEFSEFFAGKADGMTV